MKKVKLTIFALTLMASSLIIYSCSNDEDTIDDTINDTSASTGDVSITSVVQSSYNTNLVTISTSGNTIVLQSNGTPDHVSPYWGVGHALYEEQLPGKTLNPGLIASQNYIMTITTNPSEASTKEATVLGPIGMALNGVPIYNDREGGNVPVDANVLGSFDRADKLLEEYGFLRDGFPIYARKDMDGTYPTNLDVNGGHVGTTADFSTPVYHYHASNTAYLGSVYYILKAGSYHGTKGTFSN